MSLTANTNAQLIKEEALRLGFSDIGFAKAEHLAEEEPFLKQWLDNDREAGMSYMRNHFEKRVDPTLLVDDAKTIISVLLNYTPQTLQQDELAPRIARYAYGEDYHFVIKEKLALLLTFIQQTIFDDLQGRCFTDSAPLLDRAWAKRSGLGWIGKNTNLIHKKLGSYVFIGELVINKELPVDTPIQEACGGCTRCIDACPTKALLAPYQLDANKCISYLTIEHREELPIELKDQMSNWAFGCDICQEVCPWNWKARPTKEPAFQPHPDFISLSKDDWHALNEDSYRTLFKNSAIKRTKYRGLRRNLDFLK